MTASTEHRPRVAVFGSGNGTTARNLIEAGHWTCYDVRLVVGSRPGLGIQKVAEEYALPYRVLDGGTASDWVSILQEYHIDVVALAGWLRMVPPEAISAIQGRILNIHPSLLPKFGGHGMYGRRVHQAVVEAGDDVSGATVHMVTEKYDEGPIVDQMQCSIAGVTSAEDIELKVREVEKLLYPKALHQFCAALGPHGGSRI